MQLRLVSVRSRTGMQNAAVFPVPFFALARTSRLRVSASAQLEDRQGPGVTGNRDIQKRRGDGAVRCAHTPLF